MTPGELRALADGYQLKAERYWDDYQRDGTTAQKRAYDRNQGLAEALYDASDARHLREQLARLRELVLILDVRDARGPWSCGTGTEGRDARGMGEGMGADCSETMAVWKKIAGESGILWAGVPQPMTLEMRFEEGELKGKAKTEKADPVSNPAHYMGHTDVTCADALSSMLGYPAEMHYGRGVPWHTCGGGRRRAA